MSKQEASSSSTAASSTGPAGRGSTSCCADGYSVSVVQNPTLSLEGDADVTRRVLDRQDGPTVLVGHSYGGAVISEAGLMDRRGPGLHRRLRPGQGRVGQHTHRRPPAAGAGAADPAAQGRFPVPRP